VGNGCYDAMRFETGIKEEDLVNYDDDPPYTKV
jgi:hypothetical protein